MVKGIAFGLGLLVPDVCTIKSNLFGSYEVFYDELSANSLAFHSFNSKSSNFFLQKREIEYVKSQQQRRLEKNTQRVTLDESEKKKKLVKIIVAVGR